MRLSKRVIIVSTVMLLATAGAAAVLYPDKVRLAIDEFTPFDPAQTTSDTVAADPTVIVSRLPVDSISEGPAVYIGGLDHQSGINSQDLEISNVRLGGKRAGSGGAAYISGMKLAMVATERQFEFRRPTNPGLSQQVEGVFSMNAVAEFGDAQLRNSTYVVASAAAKTDGLLIPQPANVTLPRLPDHLGKALSLPGLQPQNNSGRIALLEQSYRLPTAGSALDQSPFGIVCTPVFTATVQPGAMVRLVLSSPCHPYSTVIISHDRLKFTERTSHSGALDMLVPAFDTNAQFSAEFENGWQLFASAPVPEIKTVKRVAILWNGAFDLDLHAYEFGAAEGAFGHVHADRPRSALAAASYGGGFIVRLGDGSLPEPKRAEIYSYPLAPVAKSGTVRLVVQAFAGAVSCDQKASMTNLRSDGGKVVSANILRFTLPGCDNATAGKLVVNAIRDLNITQK